MSNYFVNLPAARVPENAMLNFEPVNNAFEAVRRQNNSNREFDQQQQQLEAQNADRTYNRQRAVKQDARTEVEWFGKQAAAIDRLQGPQRAAAWQTALRRHPDAASLTPDYLDPVKGPQLVMAEAGQWRDPREDALKDLEVEKARTGIDLNRAQIAVAQRKSDNVQKVGPGETLYRVQPDGRAEPLSEPIDITTTFKDAKQLADVEEGMRKEYTTHSKDFSNIREGYRRIQTGANIDNGAGDLAIVYGYMKMLDPNSVVREGEFATAENTTGIPAYVLNLYNKAVNGDRLPPDARGRFVSASRELYANASQQNGQTRAQYEDLARRKGIDPRNIIINQESAINPAILEEARAAIASGADPAAVAKRLRDNGIDPGALQ